MQTVGRLIPGLAGKLIEGLVLFVTDLRLVFQPQRLDLVDPLAVEQNRKSNKVAVGFDQMLHPRLGRVLRAILLEVHHDLRSALLTRRIGDLISAHAVTRPHQLAAISTPAARMHAHLVGHHERGIKPDTELTDHVRWRSAVFLDRFEEGLGAGMSNGSKIFHQLLMRHADSMVGNRERLCLFIGCDVDLQGQIGLMDVLLSRLKMAELLHRVGGIRDQLAQENFLVGVKRVDDQVEELLDFGLERVFFGGRCAHDSIKKLGNGAKDTQECGSVKIRCRAQTCPDLSAKNPPPKHQIARKIQILSP